MSHRCFQWATIAPKWATTFCDGADLKNKHICPDRSYGLFLTCEKKMRSDIHILTIVMIVTHQPKSLFLYTYYFIHTWAAKHCQHRREWVHPCSSLKADWVFPLTMWDRPPNNFLLMAWLGYFSTILACPDLAADHCHNSNTYKSHRYTTRLKQYKAQYFTQWTHIHNLFKFYT
jgi:hypothetical protein